MRPGRAVLIGLVLGLPAAALGFAPEPVAVRPAGQTEPVAKDADDPAIWIHPRDPARSLVLGTDKAAAPDGALYVFGLDGKLRQRIGGIDRPNNVDVEYVTDLGGRRADLAVITERYRHRLRAFRIDPESGTLTDVSGALQVFAGETGDRSEPMGVGLYRRPRDGAVFALVSRKGGPVQGYLGQYRLRGNRQGKVDAVWVRDFGMVAAGAEVEAVAVDDALGYVYYAEEARGIHKWAADPEAPAANHELALFGRDGFAGDREGIAICPQGNERGYVICTEQREGNSRYHVYRREGEPGRPHDHSMPVMIFTGGADSTDGIEATTTSLTPGFPSGLFVAMNSSARNFLLFRWDDVLHDRKD